MINDEPSKDERDRDSERSLPRAEPAPNACECLSEDPAVAREAISRAAWIGTLVDESHFGVSIRRCRKCGQQFLNVFCETVDWADGDDPQSWMCVPISASEVAALQSLGAAVEEAKVLAIVQRRRRFLHDKHPKGAPRALCWVTGSPWIPPHD